jgi:hypothetical protein
MRAFAILATLALQSCAFQSINCNSDNRDETGHAQTAQQAGAEVTAPATSGAAAAQNQQHEQNLQEKPKR